MWIDGRRAVRPDREYYRSVRRQSLRQQRGRRVASAAIVGTLAIVAIALVLWWIAG